MRYALIGNVTFTDANGVARQVKDMRETPAYSIAQNIQVSEGVSYDEVACRVDVYGEGAESLAYKIWEANAVAIVDMDFEIDKLRQVAVPV